MKYYKTDGTINGIFTCIFNVFMSREIDIDILSTTTSTTLIDKIEEVKTNHQKAELIQNELIKYAGNGILHDIYYAHRSNENNKDSVIFHFILKLLKRRCNISKDYTLPEVLSFYDLIKRIALEVHKTKTTLSFLLTKSGINYCCITPNHNIADLLLYYSSEKFFNQPIVIHDIRRNIVALNIRNERKIIKINSSILGKMNESQINSLCNKYYNYHVYNDITEIKNVAKQYNNDSADIIKYNTKLQII